MNFTYNRTQTRLALLATALMAFGCAARAQQVTLVNMIPNSLSGETNRDSEPNLAVNPAQPNQIIGSAFTPDPMGSSSIPLFVSTNGGTSWTLTTPIVPGTSGSCFTPICDITIRFGGTSNLLYVSDLNPLAAATRLEIWKVANPTTAPATTVLQQRTDPPGFPDQPYIAAATVIGGEGTGKDRIVIGTNEYLLSTGKTANFDHTPDATPPEPAGFSNTIVETRATASEDSPSVRPAIHPDGTVYGLYAAFRGTGTEVVVVRDDHWATGATPFRALLDTDTQPGIRVVSNLTGATAVGSQRAGTGLAIAVDPNNSQNVYIVYGEGSTSATYTLHVRNSTTGGSSWSGDLYTIASATNPGIAVTTGGEVGFLYQRANSGRFETHLITTTTNFSSNNDILLANVPDSSGSYGGSNPIGDYACLLAVGKDFYGVFSAYNTPDPANFYPGVIFQRNHDFTTHTLTDLASAPVAASIDPFYFHVSNVTTSSDFYVRDWSDSPTSHDNGQEPSTNPVFYANSDVWNRRDNTSGSFDPGTDRPDHQDPQESPSNYAFVRVSRNAAAAGGSPDVSVTARFLYADFGLGTHYTDAAMAAAPTLTFSAADTEKNLTDGNGYAWTLPMTHSTHVCMAVEISAPGDNYTGDLAGHAPGWPTTDLMVINDNNKAQRNMGIWSGATDHTDTLTYYTQIHNAATFTRDMSIRYDISPAVARRLRVSGIEVIGGQPALTAAVANPRTVIAVPKAGSAFALRGMRPGENRWVGITTTLAAGAKEGELFTAGLTETDANLNLNGVEIGVRAASEQEQIKSSLRYHAAVFHRIAALYDSAVAKELADAAAKLSKEEVSGEAYTRFVTESLARMKSESSKLLGAGDPFGVNAAIARLEKLMSKPQPTYVAVAHAALLNKVDTTISLLDKAKGDTADILQNVYWQRDLYRKAGNLREIAPKVVEASTNFIQAFESRKLDGGAFHELVAQLNGSYRDTAGLLKNATLDQKLAAMEKVGDNPQLLQGAHREFLLELQTLAK